MPRPKVSPLEYRHAKKTQLDKDIQHFIRYHYNHGIGGIVQAGAGIIGGIVKAIKAKKEAQREAERKRKEAEQKAQDEENMRAAVAYDEQMNNDLKYHQNKYNKNNWLTKENVKNPIYEFYDQKSLQAYEPGAARVDYVWVPDVEYYNSLGYDTDKHKEFHEKENNGSHYRRELIYNQEWEKTMDDNFIEEDEQVEANGGKVEYYKDAGKDGKIYAFRKVTYPDAEGKPHVEVKKLADIGTWESAEQAEANSNAYIESLKGTDAYNDYLSAQERYDKLDQNIHDAWDAVRTYNELKANKEGTRAYAAQKQMWDENYADKYTDEQMADLTAKYKAAGYKTSWYDHHDV